VGLGISKKSNMKNIITYIINLMEERERKYSIRTELKEIEVNPVIIKAYDGHNKKFPFYKYKHLSTTFWRRKSDFKPGAFACYLSHAKCWEIIAKADQPYGLVLEDDVSIDKSAFLDFKIDNEVEDFDVIFITPSGIRLVKDIKNKKRFVDVSTALKQLVINNGSVNKIPPPGAYGYIVSKKGASKLLTMINTRKISMGVDYAMCFNSLNSSDMRLLMTMPEEELSVPMDIFIEKEKKCVSLGYPYIELKSYIYTFAPIVKIKPFPSNIGHDIFVSNDVFKR